MSVLAVCPSRNRPGAALATLASFEETRRGSRSRLVFVVDDDDELRDQYPPDCTIIVPATGCSGDAIRLALTPAVLADATVVGFLGDDNRFRTPGWDTVFDAALASPGIAYGDDGIQHERLPTSWWLSRALVDEWGLVPEPFRHLYTDNFWRDMGQGAGCLRYFPWISIEHLHPDVGKAQTDAVYQRSSAPSSPNATLDRQAYERWAATDRPRDVRRLRHLVSGGPIRVLADYHHPALYESLAILFEDRFGWELYRPIGPEWKYQRYWDFINLDMGFDWPAFLTPEGPYPEAYPRVKRGVTLDQARAMDWDYILCSVWQNQAGFARFAAEKGATFVHQIGNAKNAVDWGLPAKYLISAAVPVEGHDAVVYHQEFDTRLFVYRPPARTSRRVANFSLRFNWQGGAYADFVEAQRLAPEFDWHDYGTLYGELARQADVAEAMPACAFIWHDKPIGDGFGHVIHNAAAVGRPVVGHASYYRGRLAEPFWRDGETCIDLDRHPVAEAVELMREIMASPKRHRSMCEAMRDTFEAVVDFDADAARVKALLTGGTA